MTEQNRLRPCETKLTGIGKDQNIHHVARKMSSATAEAVETKSSDDFSIRMPIMTKKKGHRRKVTLWIGSSFNCISATADA